MRGTLYVEKLLYSRLKMNNFCKTNSKRKVFQFYYENIALIEIEHFNVTEKMKINKLTIKLKRLFLNRNMNSKYLNFKFRIILCCAKRKSLGQNNLMSC